MKKKDGKNETVKKTEGKQDPNTFEDLWKMNECPNETAVTSTDGL